MRDVWGDWPRPDADLDFFETVVESRAEVVAPHVLLVTRGRERVGTVVARLERVPLDCKIGYRTIYKPLVRAITVVPGGVEGADDSDVASAMIQEFRAELARGEADLVNLAHLPIASPLCRLALENPGSPFRQHATRTDPHWTGQIPASLDTYLRGRSRRTRQNVRRYGKRLLREFGDRVSVEVLRSGADIERVFREIDAVAEKTYQRRLGVGFADTKEQRRLVELGLKRDWFRAWVLLIDGEPRAFWHGMAYHGTFFIGSPGYDPALATHHVGMFLQMRMIEDLCRDPAVFAIDYGFGDAQYKRSFADESRDEADVRIFAPSVRGTWLELSWTASLVLDRIARWVVTRVGIADRLKRAARRGSVILSG